MDPDNDEPIRGLLVWALACLAMLLFGLGTAACSVAPPRAPAFTVPTFQKPATVDPSAVQTPAGQAETAFTTVGIWAFIIGVLASALTKFRNGWTFCLAGGGAILIVAAEHMKDFWWLSLSTFAAYGAWKLYNYFSPQPTEPLTA